MNIDELKPGRLLDALVHDVVMNLKVPYDFDPKKVETQFGCNTCGSSGFLSAQDLPFYSTDIAAALAIVYHMTAHPDSGESIGYEPDFQLRWDIRCTDTKQWTADFYDGHSKRKWGNLAIKTYSQISPAHAICLAALKAVKNEY